MVEPSRWKWWENDRKHQCFQGVIGRGGAEGTRTLYLLVANEALYQMSYRPKSKSGRKDTEEADGVNKPFVFETRMNTVWHG